MLSSIEGHVAIRNPRYAPDMTLLSVVNRLLVLVIYVICILIWGNFNTWWGRGWTSSK